MYYDGIKWISGYKMASSRTFESGLNGIYHACLVFKDDIEEETYIIHTSTYKEGYSEKVSDNLIHLKGKLLKMKVGRKISVFSDEIIYARSFDVQGRLYIGIEEELEIVETIRYVLSEQKHNFNNLHHSTSDYAHPDELEKVNSIKQKMISALDLRAEYLSDKLEDLF